MEILLVYAGLAIFALVFFKVLKKKDMFTMLAAVLLVVGYIASPGMIQGLTAGGGIGAGGVVTTISTAGVGRTCSGITTITLNTAGRNPLNNTLEYMGSTFYVVPSDSGGQPVASGTGTAGSTLTYTAVSVPCSAGAFAGKVYAVADASASSDVADYSISGTGGNVVLNNVPDTATLTIISRDSTLVNTSISATASGSETTATGMSAGDSRNGYIDLSVATGKAQYGSGHDGLVFCVDTVDSSAFSDSGMTVSVSSVPFGWTLSEIPCSNYPKTSAYDSCNRCYKSPAIKASDGTVRLAWTMNNDLADAGASSDPIMYIEDVVYAQDTDGKIVLGTHNSGGTNLGESQCKYTWANS